MSKNTRERSFSIQYVENRVQCYPGMELRRVVVAHEGDCGRKNLAVQVIEVEWPRLILLLHIGQ